MDLTGDIRINGSPYTKHDLKCISGYVMQDDLVNPNLTVEETLIYTAGDFVMYYEYIFLNYIFNRFANEAKYFQRRKNGKNRLCDENHGYSSP